MKAISWRADLPNPAVFGRDPFQHTIKQLSDSVFDDLYNMNTQSGSQVYLHTDPGSFELMLLVGRISTRRPLSQRGHCLLQ